MSLDPEELKRRRAGAQAKRQAQLLSEEEEFTEEADEETPEEDESSEDGCAYQNFSNGYGKQPRNAASGYKAYNSDVTDTDLERYSEEVRQPKKSGCLGILAAGLLLLTAVAVAALLWWYWKRGGVL